MHRLSLAILGGGINSAVGYAHYSAINLSNKFNIFGGHFSKNHNLNYQTAATYNTVCYKNTQSLLKDNSVFDALVILTPSNYHYKDILLAIKHKIPVICEKSLACNSKEALNIKKELKDNFLSVVYNYICYPSLKELKSIINKGKLGKIINIQIEMPQEGFLKLNNNKPIAPQSWRLEDGIIPVISLDLGVHLHSIIKYLTGQKPVETVAIYNSNGNFKKVIDNVSCLIRYTNNLSINMWYSKSALGNKNGLKVRVFGEKGAAEWYQCEPEILKMADNKGKRWIIERGTEEAEVLNENKLNRFKAGHPAGFIEALANFYEDVYEDLTNENQPKLTFGINESLEGLQLFEAISKSARTNKWIKI